MSSSKEFKVVLRGFEYSIEVDSTDSSDPYVFIKDCSLGDAAIPLIVFRALVDMSGFGRLDMVNDLTEELNRIYAKHEQD